MSFFLGTQERVRNSRGKRAISVRATEVLLYIVPGCERMNSQRKVWSGPKDLKKFMLNSAMYETINAYKYKHIKTFNTYEAQMSLKCYFSCL